MLLVQSLGEVKGRGNEGDSRSFTGEIEGFLDRRAGMNETNYIKPSSSCSWTLLGYLFFPEAK